MLKNKKQYLLGVDGGGTKTIALLADLKGKILARGAAGSSSPRNLGIKKAAENVARAIKAAIKDIDKKSEILSVFVGLPSVQEEFRSKKGEIKKELLKQKGISKIAKSKIIIDSDQITAFRSGTDEKDGLLVIAGTGHVAHGWQGKKEFCANGWGWLADEGSAFWIGSRTIQAVFKDLDGRTEKTLMTRLISKKLSLDLKILPGSQGEIKDREKLALQVYSDNFIEKISSFSLLAHQAAQKKDKTARVILTKAGKELSLSARSVIRKLKFQKKEFPLVLAGGVFRSEFVLKEFKKEVKKIAPKAVFIRPKNEPAQGAVRLALEQLKCKK